MAWVRLDDQIAGNQKITAAAAEDLASIGLHLLARPWTNTQAISGYVPVHQPGVIAVDKRKGPKLAAILVKHHLWHIRGEECPACQKRIAEDGWPHHDDGYVIHDWWKYNPPERERTVPGTPSDISEKRREAGRTGGLRSAARRQQARQEVGANGFGDSANEANGQAKSASKTSDLLPADASNDSKPSSNGVTPVPVVAPNGATTGPEPVPPTAGFASNNEAKPLNAHERDDEADPAALVLSVTKRAEPITNAYYDKNPMCKWPAVNGIVIHALKTGRYADETIQAALLRLADDGRSVTIETLRLEIEGMPAIRQGANGHSRASAARELPKITDETVVII